MAEMSFLRRVSAQLSLSSKVRKDLGRNPLLLCVKSTKLRRFVILVRITKSDLEMPQDPPGGTGKYGWGEGHLDYPALPAATAGQLWMDGWISRLK